MAINPFDAVSAYSKSGGLLGGGSSGATDGAVTGGGSFSDMLGHALGDVTSTLHAGEKASMSAVTGKADMSTVAVALDNAEVVLDEVIAIRDKVISAYQSITSSAI